MVERSRRWAAVGFALGAVTALATCRDAEVRPGMAVDCNDPDCIDVRGNGSRVPVASESGVGAGGGAGSGNMPGGGAGTLAGVVREVSSSDLVSTQNLRATVEIRAPDAAGDDVVAETGQGGAFRLDGIDVDETLWVGVGAFEDPPTEPFMDTLQAVDSMRNSLVDLLVVPRDLMVEFAAQSFLNAPVVLDPAAAHLIIRFVGQDRTPIEGARIVFPDATQVNTAYDFGDGYSDAPEATSTRGMAVLLNLAAPRYPGSPTSVVAEIDGEQFTTELQVARGAVTLVSAIVPDP